MNKYKDPLKIIIVDDSSVVRGIFEKSINKQEDMVVIGQAENGIEAIEIAKNNPDTDVITLDVEMPQMDGMTALPEIIKHTKDTRVIMASTLTGKNAEISLKSLALGARDYISKPSSEIGSMISAENFQKELIDKIRIWGVRRRRKNKLAMPTLETKEETTVQYESTFKPLKNKSFSTREVKGDTPRILAVASSTGGPQALFQFFKDLDKAIGIPVLLTQHMPAAFTPILCQHIERQSGWKAKEGEDGEHLEKNTIYVAPGDYHMTIAGTIEEPTISLNQNPPENFCRPAADPMLKSIVNIFKDRVLAVVLTGMGKDGLAGCQALVDQGGNVIAQDKETSVVWGMPGAVATANLCAHILPISEIGLKASDIILDR